MTLDEYNKLKRHLTNAARVQRLVMEEIRKHNPTYGAYCNHYQGKQFTLLRHQIEFLNEFFRIHEGQEKMENVIEFKRKDLKKPKK